MAKTTVVASILSISFTYKLLVLIVIILLGSNTYALKTLKVAREEKLILGRFAYFESFMIAIFSGLIFFLTTVYFVDNWILAWVSAGIGSTMGMTGITRIGDLLMDFLSGIAKKQ